MQPNQLGQQLNHTFFIQGGAQNTGGAVISANNLFQQIRLPQGGNMSWSVNGGQVMPHLQNSISLSQLTQGTPRQQPMIINTNQINMGQRFISQNQIVNQSQINQPIKVNTMQTQIQQQPFVQAQQQHIRQINQTPVSIYQKSQQSIQVIDNEMVDHSTSVPQGTSGTMYKVENKTENKVDTAIEEENDVDSVHTINSKKLTQMVQSIDIHLLLDDDLKSVFTQYLEEFLINVTDSACKLAKLRNSNILETKDFQYIMERDWGVYVPGYPTVTEKPSQVSELEIHKNRINLIKKANRL